jgi:hypothetical protein
MKTRAIAPLVLGLLLALVLVGAVMAQASANYDLHWNLLSGGGGARTSTNYRLDDALGQWPGGSSTSAAYHIAPGFLTGAAHSGVFDHPLYVPLVLRKEG